MRYVGSKAKLAKAIESHIIKFEGQVYCEPFCGGLNSFARIAPHYPVSLASDSHPDLIAMWKAAYYGWVPPTTLTLDEYQSLKDAPDYSALRGFVGFGCSFGGKWFGGYAKGGVNSKGEPRNHIAESSRAVQARIASLRNTKVAFQCMDYEWVWPSQGWVIYCDPPYAGTLGYGSDFDSDNFWKVASGWAAVGAKVFVSEYVAPSDWECVAEFPHRMSVALSGDRRETVEKLFTK